MKSNPVEPQAVVERTAQGEALNDLILTIFRVSGRLNRAGDALSRDLNLTSARWQVLGAIASQPRTIAQIARQNELTRQGILWVVQAMVKDGLVELIHNPDHRRAKLVRHTQAGADIYREITSRQRRWVSELASPFSEAELKEGTRLLTRLAEAVVAEEEEGE
ncbi:MarR family transcriptional regulator [Sphingobium jiangsuense]|uniref:DNA-binding MarR family transcriptional regulator n=1 Tax=Sphingobium jiangsuense TaxID=870476 RepID=A0A7W6BGL8_9SPHN|nr:MarR family transcriptional regulator [Sphingobium jiangsuense]MBB3925684.1 DNA-binding MarR family transcriptional regulator [Sphingobium jiangsuense]GLT00354.1 MarR family transcriptional regulator [Sphingobium jiangsuense]